ncbi:MAG TPA: hypothetical protein VKT32_06490 [Chthonomonadaceae bacterium]|nr:hypothetical protein [Chthonomonadaceae bacterium]
MKKEIPPTVAVAIVVVILVVVGFFYWRGQNKVMGSISVMGPDGKRHMGGMKAGGGAGPGSQGAATHAAGD